MTSQDLIDCEPDLFWDANDTEFCRASIIEIAAQYDNGDIVKINCAKKLASFEIEVTYDDDIGTFYEYLDTSLEAARYTASQRGISCPDGPKHWHERIKEAHPKSDPEFWPDGLRVKYMEAEILELRAALAAAPAQPAHYEEQPDGTMLPVEPAQPDTSLDACEWRLDEFEGIWESSCGESWSFIDGGPKENNIRFCQGCGKPAAMAEQVGINHVNPDKTPTDSEILDAAEGFRSQYKHGDTAFDYFDALAFARAVLAKWGTPAPVGVEPVAWQATYTNASGSQNVYTTSSYDLALENSENGSPTPLYTHPQPVAQDDYSRRAGLTAPPEGYAELPKPPHWGAMHTGRGGKVEMYPQQYREALDRAFTVGATHALRTGVGS